MAGVPPTIRRGIRLIITDTVRTITDIIIRGTARIMEVAGGAIPIIIIPIIVMSRTGQG